MLINTSKHEVYYQAGYSIGSQLLVNALEEIPAKIGELGMGDLKLQSAKNDKIIVKWHECLTCSHLLPIGEPQCYLETGLLAGVLNKLFKKKVEVKETKCWGTGEKYCEMEATIYPTSTSEGFNFVFSEESNKLLLALAVQSVQANKNYQKVLLGYMNDVKELSLSNVETLFHMMPFGLIIVDSQGKVVEINKTSVHMLGIGGQRVQGRLLEEIIPLTNYSEILTAGKPQVWTFQSTKGETIIVIGMPFSARVKNEYMLFQLLPAERELVYHLLESITKSEIGIEYNYKVREVNCSKPFQFNHIRTLNWCFKNVLILAQKAAKTNATILIVGESGTGKGVLAQAIHQESFRRHGPFIRVNCAAIPPELLEAELFGYEEGAFTGAKRGGKPGKFELADGGTIFLDEIGDMPLNMQAKLLTVLQEKEVERLGSTKAKKIDVRVIAATNRNLEEMVQKGYFREDLFYRLNVVKLVLPPLRERPEDIPLLVEDILKRINEEFGKKLRISPAAMEYLLSYSWPGNVRELENVLERAAILAEGQEIQPQHLMIDYFGQNKNIKKISLLCEVQMKAEKEAIIRALEAFGGKKSRAAKALGISRQALYAKMVRYGLLKK
ncbi:transcriptional regulator [Caldanaerobacter subterraneus subsp. yonseiensis KB-1]|uniref:Transcriptional regulator n=1 Tax=Caldanaerobacter subterraneus subsp. yonseiensis KB-1 TaxID=1388761 RepID=U5CQH0_CALSX|nr:sigma 54-interacting transcriptional regulator [Caldanaerobacter subterraneus]ERM92238.1 transcriptional regulator [Caldanaerobacter subterraneus subsp. yonseiensis KB-1]